MNTIFYIYFIIVTVLSMKQKYLWAVILSALGTIHTFVFFFKTSPHTLAFLKIPFVVVLFLLCIYFLHIYNKFLQEKLENAKGNLKGQNDQLKKLEDKDQSLQKKNEKIKKSLDEIKQIYEYVKKLGSTLDFNTAIETLRWILISLLKFDTGRLILTKNDQPVDIYEISTNGISYINPQISQPKKYESNLLKRIYKNPQMFLHEKGRLSPLGILPNDIKTLLAIPLNVEQQLLGVLILENLKLTNTDKIHFIALQFAMEIKKTKLFKQVKELSIIDSLTQVSLRRYFMELFSNELERGSRQHKDLCVLIIDIDYFKKYNDEYGHLTGDYILTEVAKILKDKSRDMDIICRYGGDEFALVLPGANIEDAQIVAERFRKAVSEHPFKIRDEKVPITISLGVAHCPCQDMDKENIAKILIDTADKALYSAKSLGRNRVASENIKKQISNN